MRLTVDTNILIRVLVEDDPEQADLARRLLDRAELIAVPTPILCELVWVLRGSYGFTREEVAEAIEGILDLATVVTDVPAVEAGVAMLHAGGDFADGLSAAQGRSLGGDVFATFDRGAVRTWSQLGGASADPATLLSDAC